MFDRDPTDGTIAVLARYKYEFLSSTDIDIVSDGETINASPYTETLTKLKKDIRSKRYGLLTYRVMLMDNKTKSRFARSK